MVKSQLVPRAFSLGKRPWERGWIKAVQQVLHVTQILQDPSFIFHGTRWNSSPRALCHSCGTGCNMTHTFCGRSKLALVPNCLGDLYYDRGASLCVKSKRLSKQMQILQIVFQTSETACHAEGTCWGVDGKKSAIIKACACWLEKPGFTSISCAVGFSCPLWYIAPVTILNYATWLKQTFWWCLAQLVTIIISKIISPDPQERKRFSILGARKVKNNILLKVDRCLLVPNNLLKSSLVPWR